MIKCSNCQHEIDSKSIVCSNCGIKSDNERRISYNSRVQGMKLSGAIKNSAYNETKLLRLFGILIFIGSIIAIYFIFRTTNNLEEAAKLLTRGLLEAKDMPNYTLYGIIFSIVSVLIGKLSQLFLFMIANIYEEIYR